jgi:hypothetical protein
MGVVSGKDDHTSRFGSNFGVLPIEENLTAFNVIV